MKTHLCLNETPVPEHAKVKNWRDVRPGDMIVVSNRGFMKPFENDVFLVVSVDDPLGATIKIRMYSGVTSLLTIHSIEPRAIKSVFEVFRLKNNS